MALDCGLLRLVAKTFSSIEHLIPINYRYDHESHHLRGLDLTELKDGTWDVNPTCGVVIQIALAELRR